MLEGAIMDARHIGSSLDEVLQTLLKKPEFRKAWERKIFIEKLGQAIRHIRQNAGLTQVMLAQKIGSTQSTVSRLEHGKTDRLPRISTLGRLARACGYTLRLQPVDANTIIQESELKLIVP